MLLCAGAGLHAQRSGFVDVDWTSMKSDSVRPWSGFGIALDGSWQDSAYTAKIEYPELSKISDSDLKRWNLQADDIPLWPDVEASVGVSRGSATLDAGFMPVIKRDGAYYAILSYKASVSARPAARRAPVQTQDRYTRSSVLSEGKWVKIRIAASGIYKLSYSSLRSMGFSDPSKVRLFGYGGAVLPETNLQELTDDVPEQPMWRGDGYMLFFGQGPVSWKKTQQGYEHQVNTYSDWGYYFLTDRTDSVTASFALLEADTIPGDTIDTYPDFTVYDPDEFSWYRSGRRMFEKYDYANGNSKTYGFDLTGLASDSVGVKVAFSASSAKATKVTVRVNDSETGVLTIGPKSSGASAVVNEKSFVSRGQFSEHNTVTLVHDRASGESGHLDYIRLNFIRRLALYGSSTVFRVDKNVTDISFSISGSNADVQIWKLSPDGTCAIVPSVFSDGTTVTRRASYTPDDVLVAVNVKGAFPEPEKVGAVNNQNLHALEAVDMVIVVPASDKLTHTAERLAAAHRSIDSLKVEVVRADRIYNEFSSGTPDATAIRRFMKMLYDRSDVSSAPRYLLLMGNGAWDNRMHVSDWAGQNPDDYLLCYESYESLSHTASYVMEDYFGLLDDTEGNSLLTEKVDLGIGRLPFTTASQASAKVDRIIEYMQGRYSGAWSNKILVLGDDGDNNTHMNDADRVAQVYQSVSPAIDVRKIYWDAFRMEVTSSFNGYPSVRKLLLEQFDEGALIVNYSGHGSTEDLSHELVMNKADMKNLKSKRLPFWITASCDIAPFDSPLESMGLNLVCNTDGGAIGILSTTRTVYATLNGCINRSFSRYVISRSADGRVNTLGDALRLAKNELVTSGVGENDRTENKIHYVLLGDPALRLAVAELTAVVDQFNEFDTTVTGAAKAGSVVTVTGHIECNGERVTDYRGLLSSTIYDNERIITCHDNLMSADKPFTFAYRDRVLYSGTDSVRNGEFTFSFPVPLDINYSNQKGQIMLYASGNDGRNANGIYDNFTVGGTADGLSVDSVGPEISLYLNTPTFQYGGSVNATPMLVAELRDSSGLNTSGNGLGHDILLVIDNNPNWTWVLNGNFEQTAGDYTSGRVMFTIPELPEGKHELMLRAWDVMNNSTTVYLGFKVVNDLKPKFSIDVTASPARESTAFVITHDRPGQNASVTIQVSSSDGMLQWVNTVRDDSGSGVTVVDWNLQGSSGHRMQPGLYIVRAIVGTDGGGSASATCKLVIVGR